MAARTSLGAERKSGAPQGKAPARAEAAPVRRFAGNQANLRRLQAELTIGAVNDPLEREADGAADRLMGISKPASLIVDEVLRTPGAPLEPDLRREAEGRFGRNFDSVRVHTGPRASEVAALVNAPAFTLGRHIVAHKRWTDPDTPEGHAILSHELTHVVQQASFRDRDLFGAEVLDAAHPSEQEASSSTDAATALTAPAIQRAPLDLVTSKNQLEIDLTKSSWRQTLQFAGGQRQIVYVLRDITTGELLKVGKTTVAAAAGRFGEYVAAGNRWSRKLAVDVWTFRARSTKSAEAFEAQMRTGLVKTGARLPWDNTVGERGPRLGRPGQGIPLPKAQTETQFIDEVERLRVKHAPPNIAPRRGVKSKSKAKQGAHLNRKAIAPEQSTVTRLSGQMGQGAVTSGEVNAPQRGSAARSGNKVEHGTSVSGEVDVPQRGSVTRSGGAVEHVTTASGQIQAPKGGPRTLTVGSSPRPAGYRQALRAGQKAATPVALAGAGGEFIKQLAEGDRTGAAKTAAVTGGALVLGKAALPLGLMYMTIQGNDEEVKRDANRAGSRVEKAIGEDSTAGRLAGATTAAVVATGGAAYKGIKAPWQAHYTEDVKKRSTGVGETVENFIGEGSTAGRLAGATVTAAAATGEVAFRGTFGVAGTSIGEGLAAGYLWLTEPDEYEVPEYYKQYVANLGRFKRAKARLNQLITAHPYSSAALAAEQVLKQIRELEPINSQLRQNKTWNYAVNAQATVAEQMAFSLHN